MQGAAKGLSALAADLGKRCWHPTIQVSPILPKPEFATTVPSYRD